MSANTILKIEVSSVYLLSMDLNFQIVVFNKERAKIKNHKTFLCMDTASKQVQ